MQAKKILFIPLLIIFSLVFAGCTSKPATETDQPSETVTEKYNTVFPLPDNVSNFTKGDEEEQVNFQTSSTLEENLEFYRSKLEEKGLTERTVNTAVTDTTFSIVMDGWENDKAVVVQGVKLEENKTNINLRFEDI